MSFTPDGSLTRTTYGPGSGGRPTTTASRAGGGNAANGSQSMSSASTDLKAPSPGWWVGIVTDPRLPERLTPESLSSTVAQDVAGAGPGLGGAPSPCRPGTPVRPGQPADQGAGRG